MVNNFQAARQKLYELEPIVNSVPVKSQGARQAVYMIMRHIENIEGWIDRAEKHERHTR